MLSLTLDTGWQLAANFAPQEPKLDFQPLRQPFLRCAAALASDSKLRKPFGLSWSKYAPARTCMLGICLPGCSHQSLLQGSRLCCWLAGGLLHSQPGSRSAPADRGHGGHLEPALRC